MTQLINHFLTAVLLISFATAGAAAQDNRVIGSIEFVGLKQVTAEDAIATSGLIVGEPFKVEAVDAAAQKLVDSGIFKQLGYRTRTVGNKVTITFEIEEAKSDEAPVVFDNFIWFTDEQLLTSIHQLVPTFYGRIPNEGKLPESIAAALQQLLNDQKIPGKVEYTAAQDLSGHLTGHVFSVTGIKMQNCKFIFPGAKNIPEDKLREVSQREMGEADYSREVVRGFASLKLISMYREVGQLQAKFADPIGKPDQSCKNGVEVTIPVTEGLIYSFSSPEWYGMSALTVDQLNDLLGMKAGEVANGIKFDRGVVGVQKAYGQFGYIEARIRPQAEFDDSTQRVTYKISVSEGPQYRMGSLFYKGLSERDAQAFRAAWRLRRGQVFDATYHDEFFKTDARSILLRLAAERQATGKQPPKLDIKRSANRETLTVDVTFELTN
ncbi:MAG TPA: POTRA domain-containing protein [Pyrinomonadaceae bacterium]|nr:POTRA domain-containing protein [Pyrinomonadaceae bacterium]